MQQMRHHHRIYPTANSRQYPRSGRNKLVLGYKVGQLLLHAPQVYTALKFAGGAYLLYLAARIAFAGAKIAFIERAEPPGIRGGILLQIINQRMSSNARSLPSRNSHTSHTLTSRATLPLSKKQIKDQIS